MACPLGDAKLEPLRVDFDRRLKLEFMAATSHPTPVCSRIVNWMTPLAYNLGNFLRTLALPEAVAHWSLTTLRA